MLLSLCTAKLDQLAASMKVALAVDGNHKSHTSINQTCLNRFWPIWRVSEAHWQITGGCVIRLK